MCPVGVSPALNFQLDMYRWEDHLRRMHGMREGRIEQETADGVLAQYNQLVQRYNSLAEVAVEAGRTADALQEQVNSKNCEIIELHRRLVAAETENLKMREVWAHSSAEMSRRMYVAEDALKDLRSQQD